MPGERKDALAEIERCLREHREHLAGLWDPSEAEEDLRATDRALSLLPRLREVVDAARCCYSLNIQANERLKKALAALEGGKDGG